MQINQKLAILASAARYDASCASSGSKRANRGGLGETHGVGICHSYTPDGRCVSLLKILLTNFCIYDCKFCVNRVSSDTPRARFKVEEVVQLTMQFYRRNYIEGLFLSSGIIQSPDYTMEQLADVARRLREQERFFGYIHLKAIPGASEELLERAGRHADRLSANIELPTDADVKQLAPDKPLRTVQLTMSTIRDRFIAAQAERRASRKAPRFSPAGQSTQMVIGATPTPDRAVLQTASRLYTQQRLKRVYYSAFSPIPHADAVLPYQPPPLLREHRLYEADWLMRFYGFDVSELTEGDDENLALDIDPKLAWALRHRDFFPIDINRASRDALVRIPGLGVRNAQRILAARRNRALRLTDLRRLRVAVKRAQPFIIAADHNAATRLLDHESLRDQVAPRQRQLSLFETGQSARNGEL